MAEWLVMTNDKPIGIDMEACEVKTIYGYARVSTLDQNADRQLIALRAAGVPDANVFTDHKSGKDFNRPAWKKLVRRLHAGDLLVVSSIDRFGRSYEEILAEWRSLVKIKNVHIKVLDMPLLDTTTAHGLLAVFIADLVLQILSFVAETERNHIRQRQREGIAAAKARGVRFGRPPMHLPENFPELVRQVAEHRLSIRAAAQQCGISKTCFAKYYSQSVRTP